MITIERTLRRLDEFVSPVRESVWSRKLQFAYHVFLFVGGAFVASCVWGGILLSILHLCGLGFPASNLFVLSLVMISTSYFSYKSIRELNRDLRSQLSQPEIINVDVVRIENVIRAFCVYDLEDFGPGYVVETAERESVYLCGQILYDVIGDSDNPEEADDVELLAQTINLKVHSDSERCEIFEVTLSGERIAAEIFGPDGDMLSVSDFLGPDEVYVSFKILRQREDGSSQPVQEST